ncbi:hypothetical protein L6251_01710 [Candidatus Parcubacteria bacterium]|nr:hypothetical protein [Patescibacteria group bacterium]MBU4477452.1 hypothetical protein [Patescibacteria group bacterium]MCG2699117.1 hypothetical protein [Candidatus Parcubacteria bacterium]
MLNPKDPASGNPPADPAKGNPPVDPNAAKNEENIKELQRVISAKDFELKNALNELKKYSEKKPENEKIFDEMKAEIKKLANEIGKVNLSKRRDELAKSYPDILPELLVGKSDEEIPKIVDRQRDMNKKLYGDSHAFIKPEYEKEEDIDKAIKTIQEDKSIKGELAAVKILDLKRLKFKLFNH